MFKLDKLIETTNIPIFCPFYHTISDSRLPHIDPLYRVHIPKEFSNQLDLMKKHYEFVSAMDLPEILKNKSNRGNNKFAFLSFDDGLLECYSHIFPILEEKGIQATFFINPDFVDGQDIFYRYKIALLISAFLNGSIEEKKMGQIHSLLQGQNNAETSLIISLKSLEYQDIELINELIRLCDINYRNTDIYMSSTMIQELKNAGHSIGGHSLDHPKFEHLQLSEQIDHIEKSIHFCQSHFNESLRLFAFPFYDFNLGRELYLKMYTELNVDVSFGTSGLKMDYSPKNIQRLAMDDKFGELESYIKSHYIYYNLKKLVGKHNILRS